MSVPLPERADVRQLRIQAKELLSSLHNGDSEALSLAASHDPSLKPSEAKLADAQRLLARKHGFPSWPELVEKIETPALLERMRAMIDAGDADGLEKLLRESKALQSRINDSMFGFDSPPIVRASGHTEAKRLLPILVRYGADPNVRTDWWAGGFSSLDSAKGETVDLLLSLGAKWDVWSASSHGHVEILRELLDRDPASVNAPGGDGERPLHFAANSLIAKLLIEKGADLDIRDVDHESTPAQYQIRNSEVLRLLLNHGAKPDIFMAAVLNDVDLLRKLIAEDPETLKARVGAPPFVTKESEGGHIYTYNLGEGKTPSLVAAESGSRDVLRELERHASPITILVAEAWAEDAGVVARILAENPGLREEITEEDSRMVATAAQSGRTETVRLLLEAGFDPNATGMDSGTALHVACWFGYLPIVRLLIGRVTLDLPDAHHGSPPLGWACHGAQWCRNEKGDYPGVARALLEAGAAANAPANSGGTPMLQQAGKREDVKKVLREFGAT
ncbi:hypothetical protein BH11ARM2_BH11ARM2_28550 [soil metagenome]